MTEQPVLISNLNDFIFCPMSIYFHSLYGDSDRMTMQTTSQINGSAVHESVDNAEYSTRKDILQGIMVFSEKYDLIGKIDHYEISKGLLVERKRMVKTIYDGYVFQLYAQCFCLREMGYEVKHLHIHSYIDNKNYDIALPEDNPDMLLKFEQIVREIHQFSPTGFVQENIEKCRNCIYEPACDRGCDE